jgi:hypothetical protein
VPNLRDDDPEMMSDDPFLRRMIDQLRDSPLRGQALDFIENWARECLATPPTDDTPCEHLIPARACRIVGCRGASTDTPEAER